MVIFVYFQVCKNQNCKHDFCWVCLGSWEPHGSSWYNCNRYDEDEAKAARDAQEKLRSSLARYLNMNWNWMNSSFIKNRQNKIYWQFSIRPQALWQHNISPLISMFYVLSPSRYLHYYNRYMNHMQSLKFEHKLYNCIKEKMEEMQQHNMSWIEVR